MEKFLDFSQINSSKKGKVRSIPIMYEWGWHSLFQTWRYWGSVHTLFSSTLPKLCALLCVLFLSGVSPITYLLQSNRIYSNGTLKLTAQSLCFSFLEWCIVQSNSHEQIKVQYGKFLNCIGQTHNYLAIDFVLANMNEIPIIFTHFFTHSPYYTSSHLVRIAA